jgi:hypothetical protein
MTITTKIAIAAALAFGAASAALANDIETNPSTAQSAREWQEYLGQGPKHMGSATTSYGFFGLPAQQDDTSSGKHSRTR